MSEKRRECCPVQKSSPGGRRRNLTGTVLRRWKTERLASAEWLVELLVFVSGLFATGRVCGSSRDIRRDMMETANFNRSKRSREYASRGETFAPIFFWPQQQRSIGQLVRSIVREAKRQAYDSACSQVFFL
jgi:hypothetical protein